MKFRHEKQQYATVALLKAETSVVNRKNDESYIVENKKSYDWTEGDATPENLPYVIDQTSETANGRWISNAPSTTAVLSGAPIVLGPVDNGQGGYVDVADAAIDVAKAQFVKVPSGTPDLFLITNIELTAGNARVYFENQTGDDAQSKTVTLELVTLV